MLHSYDALASALDEESTRNRQWGVVIIGLRDSINSDVIDIQESGNATEVSLEAFAVSSNLAWEGHKCD